MPLLDREQSAPDARADAVSVLDDFEQVTGKQAP